MYACICPSFIPIIPGGVSEQAARVVVGKTFPGPMSEPSGKWDVRTSLLFSVFPCGWVFWLMTRALHLTLFLYLVDCNCVWSAASLWKSGPHQLILSSFTTFSTGKQVDEYPSWKAEQMVVLKTKPEEVMASEMVISEQKWTFRTSIGEQTWITCYMEKNSERKFWKWVFMSQRLRLLRWQRDSWIVKEERKVDCRKLLSWYVGVISQYQFNFGTLLWIFYLDLYLNFIYLWFIQLTMIVPLEYKGIYLLPTTKFTELMNS